MALALGLGLASLLAPPASAAPPVPPPGQGQGQGFAHRVSMNPANPVQGEALVVTIAIDGLSAEGLELVDLALDRGLRLESESFRPRPVQADKPGLRGTEVSIEMTVLEAGRRSIERIALAGREGRFVAGPIYIQARPPRTPGSPEPPPSWSWSAPATIRRFEAFAVSLVGEDPLQDASGIEASFPSVGGASLEPAAPLVWIAVALEPGTLKLPVALLSRGRKLVGRAEALTIQIEPLPQSIATSRAIGDFALRLDARREEAVAGRSLLLRLVLEGRGNQPAVKLPEPVVRLDGRVLPEGSISERRVDALRAIAGQEGGLGAYEGEAALELAIVPPRPGRLSVAFPAMPALGRDGSLVELSVPLFEAEVRKGGEAAATAKGGFGAYPAALAERLSLSSAAMKNLPALLAKGNRESRAKAIELLDRSPPGSKNEASFLEASLYWDGGERARALALLYGILRRAPGTEGVAEAALACSGELGSGPPMLGSLPPPPRFWLGACTAGLASLLLLALALPGRRRPARSHPVLIAAAAIMAAAALSSGALGLASSREQARVYAVAWTESLIAVPSPLAQGRVEIRRGVAGRIMGEAPGYVGIVLADGLSGWVPRESVYYY